MATLISPTRSIVGTSLGTLYVRLTANPQELIEGMLESQKAVTGTTAVMMKQLRSLAVLSGEVFAAVGALSVYEFAKFNQAMTESTSIMGKLSDTMKTQLAENARSLSEHTAQSATELAKAYYYLASAGLNASQSMEALPVVAKFATAGAFDLSRATSLLTDAQSALGLKVKDAAQNMENMTKVANVLTRANQIADATTEQFAEALANRAASTMKAFNIPLNEGVALLADFADQGIKGAKAGQQFYMVIRDLQRAAIKAPEAFRTMGVAVFDTAGHLRNTADIIKDLTNSLAGASEEEKRAALSMLGFQDRSLGALLAVLGTDEKLRQFQSDLSNTGNTLDEVSQKQLESFLNQMKEAWHSVQNVAIEIGEKLAPYLVDLAKKLEDGTHWVMKMQEQTGFLTATVKTVADIFKVFGLGAAVVWTTLKSIATVISTALEISFQDMNIAVGLVIRLFADWWTANKAMIQGLQEMAHTAAKTSTVLIDLAKRDLPGAIATAASMLSDTKKVVKDVSETIASSVKDSTAAVTESATRAWNVTTGLMSDAGGDLKQQWTSLADLSAKLFPPATTGANEVAHAMQATADATAAVNSNVEDTTKSVTQMGSAAKSLIDSYNTTQLLNQQFGKEGSRGGGIAQYNRRTSMMQGALTGGQFSGQLADAAAQVQIETDKLKKLQALGDKEVALQKDVEDRKMAAIDAYNRRLKVMQLQQQMIVVQAAQQAFDSIAAATEAFAGKQSGIYKAMFAISKTFAIADATIKIIQAAAQAMADPSAFTIYQKLANYAVIISQLGVIISEIASVSFTVGGKRAAGGDVMRGQSYIVGEKGPELFTPNSGGTITPNDRLGGSNVNVVINNYTDAQASVKEHKDSQGKTIEVMIRRVKKDISSEIRDGRGDITKSLESSYTLRRGKAAQ